MKEVASPSPFAPGEEVPLTQVRAGALDLGGPGPVCAVGDQGLMEGAWGRGSWEKPLLVLQRSSLRSELGKWHGLLVAPSLCLTPASRPLPAEGHTCERHPLGPMASSNYALHPFHCQKSCCLCPFSSLAQSPVHPRTLCFLSPLTLGLPSPWHAIRLL